MLFSVVLQLNKTDCPLKMKRFVEWYQGSAYEIPADIYSPRGSQTRPPAKLGRANYQCVWNATTFCAWGAWGGVIS